MKLLHLAGALALAAFLTVVAPILAHAQAVATDTTISIPVGSWLTEAAAFVGPLLAAAVVWLIRKLPAQVAAILMSMRVDQLLERAIGYAVNAVAGATKDQPLSLDVGNRVVAQALQYAVDHGPGWLIAWAGGIEAIREKIIARLDAEANAALK